MEADDLQPGSPHGTQTDPGWEAPWRASRQIDVIAAAYVAACGELADVPRTEQANTGSYSYRYAGLGAVLAATRTVLSSHGLAVVQAASAEPGRVSVVTAVLHASGQWLSFPPLAVEVPARGGPQAVGSAITYLRRYGILAALGIATDDDDGRAATRYDDLADAGEDDALADVRAWITQQLSAIRDPDERRQAKQDFRERFGLPAGLAIDDVDQAVAWVEAKVTTTAEQSAPYPDPGPGPPERLPTGSQP